MPLYKMIKTLKKMKHTKARFLFLRVAKLNCLSMENLIKQREKREMQAEENECKLKGPPSSLLEHLITVLISSKKLIAFG